MEEILSLLVNDCLFLFEDLRFRITDSVVSDSGGNAQVTLKNSNIMIRIINETGRLFLDFGVVVGKTEKARWYSIDIITEYITGEDVNTSLLDEGNLLFLRKNAEVVCNFFSGKDFLGSLGNLSELKRKRAKQLFE